MKTVLILCALVVFALVPAVGRAAQSAEDSGEYELYSPDELEELLAPVALYPDPLLAQLLPAASFTDQIHDAAELVRSYGKSAPVDRQPWDVSIKALAHYPELLLMMDEKPDWTEALGEAFANQQAEVMNAIQSLRADARAAGNLVSSSRMQVVEEGGYIRLLPPEPERIYIPVYDPGIVYYSEPAYSTYAAISFGIGFPIGVWLNRDCDWFGHRIYYHGWRGGGWIRRSRPHVNIRNNTYVNNRHRNIFIDRRRIHGGSGGAGVTAPLQRRRLPGRPLPGVSAGRGGVRVPERNRQHRIRSAPERSGEFRGSGRDPAAGRGGGSAPGMIRRRNQTAVPAPGSGGAGQPLPAPPTKVLPHRVPLPGQSDLPRQNRLPRQEQLPEQVPISPPAAREPQLPAPPSVGPPPVVAPAPHGGGIERRR